MIKALYILTIGLLTSFSTFGKSIKEKSNYEISLDTLKLYDQSRQRDIPIAIYKPTSKVFGKQKIAIFSHGYGQKKGGDHLVYSYLTEFLATKGFFVVSIQHELSTDSILPLTGNLQIARRPFWERGADNILYVINELKKTNTELDFKDISFIGHCNGGDITTLFPQKYPNIVEKIITLDNRRMALPKSKRLKFIRYVQATNQQTKVFYRQKKSQKNIK